ncbi:hypothetical protein TBLA_0A09220 [Henningerozyma blattae CBS 6284]|uniref:Peptidase M48 domain-containing protein n=1 Tax=Henningerozyma blattae (strain ATCC 34711 / CBS 6284 / DSM 70876 / NBRC 10599 / NRRL Y-10934 / UCD 77-7) TaxID=1071380 RepID=I2GX58_HENB6|nr:hypothetical protein TBLA_0A09220 [Tetrapisispora blattae CBS 6284]CCH58710.1 hypothetical protein TBLA_0A09220 [Tetrapisispora blattae CBS 6284]
MFKTLSFNISKNIIRNNNKFLFQRVNIQCYNQSSYNRFNNRHQFSITNYINDPKKRNRLALIIGATGIFYILNQEKAPVTGRRRFIWISSWLEMKISNYTYKSMLNETRGTMLPQNHPTTKKVEKIFHKIVEASYKEETVDRSQLDGIDWKIHVINDSRAPPNAFVLPGGKVFIFSEMLRICGNDDGIATVLSHEFAHQLARHTSENLSKAPIYTLLGVLLYSITGTGSFNNILMDGLLRMPASRQMETEADYIGLMIMARACFHPEEAVRLWQRMTQYERRSGLGMRNVEFLSTHPTSEKRIVNMQNWMSQARSLYEQSDCNVPNSFYQGFRDSFTGGIIEPAYLAWN